MDLYKICLVLRPESPFYNPLIALRVDPIKRVSPIDDPSKTTEVQRNILEIKDKITAELRLPRTTGIWRDRPNTHLIGNVSYQDLGYTLGFLEFYTRSMAAVHKTSHYTTVWNSLVEAVQALTG